ncbi:uncharacterized protein [Eurosta solidaginis]|uniref:uncharacterized protein n=1 Tax=Eurosta solidaginis TaxID=178769 RepID=UPI0035310511
MCRPVADSIRIFTTSRARIRESESIQYPKLSARSREIWQWCQKRKLWVQATYIKSSQNKEADKESRIKSEETEWELAEYAYEEIEHKFGRPKVDLFATNGISPDLEVSNPNCRQIIREAFITKQAPEESLQYILASLSENTLKQYSKPITSWYKFCQAKQLSPFQPTVSAVLEFLSPLATGENKYGTLNTYRSAISLLSTWDIGKDATIKRFCKGVSVLKPQRPKYNQTWDPSIVLDFLTGMGPNDKLDLGQLSRKLAILFALVTAQRVQSLSKIKISNISFKAGLVAIKIPDKIKTTSVCGVQPNLIIPAFSENDIICPVSTLQAYVDGTNNR